VWSAREGLKRERRGRRVRENGGIDSSEEIKEYGKGKKAKVKF